MKTTVSILLGCLLAVNIVFAQTPYDSFAPELKNKKMLELTPTKYRLENQDKSSEIKYIEFDEEKQLLQYYGVANTLIKSFAIDAKDLKWWVVDPRAEKYYEWSPYNYVLCNPIRNIDPQGDTVFVNNTGYITRNDNTDNFVFMSNKNELTYLGELGKSINANGIYSNLLNENVAKAENIWNPFKFKDLVRTNGDWDLKNDPNSIFGLGNDGKTTFSFQGNSMESQDIGNHHFGAVAEAYGLFPSQEFILQQAGDYQIKSGTSRPEWQVYKNVTSTYISPTGMPVRTTTKVMMPPYGDDPRDQMWIKAGFSYYKTNY
ncbi:polymorphic toxin type 44 domain-containing protein [Marinilabilia salmonicolor]|jgi:hypothetical protein|uniref:Putative RNase toxin 44 of polymorphic toxin system n=1 Tax=Marinilabilia salmonicolor TaxID=989 RepID=A0A368UIS3_9BACT|nr:polymorphic toxin type 44 domain-containing protein [Marinilabilia salmonicolor]RCW20255.1 putative RNase toxin 44 of polymorphic toxin system [Marinilabilia salmonicolor]